MNFCNYTSDFDQGNSCSYFFFSHEDRSSADRKEQLSRDMKESLRKSFSSISTYWCYVLVSDQLQELLNPAVINKETREAFNGPETIWINGIGSVRAFFSNIPILHLQQSGNSFQLIEKNNEPGAADTVVLPALPEPGYNQISALNIISEYIGKNFSFIYI